MTREKKIWHSKLVKLCHLLGPYPFRWPFRSDVECCLASHGYICAKDLDVAPSPSSLTNNNGSISGQQCCVHKGDMASHPHPSQYSTLKAPTPFSPTSTRHFLLHRNKAQLPTRLAELRSFPTNAPHHTRDRIHLPPHPCNVLTGPR
jgi:hypothetical protein